MKKAEIRPYFQSLAGITPYVEAAVSVDCFGITAAPVDTKLLLWLISKDALPKAPTSAPPNIPSKNASKPARPRNSSTAPARKSTTGFPAVGPRSPKSPPPSSPPRPSKATSSDGPKAAPKEPPKELPKEAPKETRKLEPAKPEAAKAGRRKESASPAQKRSRPNRTRSVSEGFVPLQKQMLSRQKPTFTLQPSPKPPPLPISWASFIGGPMTLRQLLSILVLSALATAAHAQSAPPNTTSLAGTWRSPWTAPISANQQWFSQDLPASPERQHHQTPGILQSQGYGGRHQGRHPLRPPPYPARPLHPGSPNTLKRWWREYPPHQPGTSICSPTLPNPSSTTSASPGISATSTSRPPPRCRRPAPALFLERPRWAPPSGSTTNRSHLQLLVAPHEFELGILAPGKHRLPSASITHVRFPPGPPSRPPRPAHPATAPTVTSAPTPLGQTWTASSAASNSKPFPVYIDDVQVYPNVEKKRRSYKIKIGNNHWKGGLQEPQWSAHLLQLISAVSLRQVSGMPMVLQ